MSTTPQQIVDAALIRYGDRFTGSVRRKIPNIRGGEFVVVNINDEKGEFWAESYVLLDGRGRIRSTFLGTDDAFAWLGSIQRRSTTSVFGLSGFEIVAAAIAVLITLTISAIVLAAVASPSGATSIDIPDVLSAALTSILGFYFGTRAGKTSQSDAAGGAEPPVSAN